MARRYGLNEALLATPLWAEEPGWRELAAIAGSGDRAAFERLFVFYAPRIKGFMRRRGASEAQSEDLTQEAMARVWRHASAYDPAKASVATWIFVLARNVWIDGYRQAAGQPLMAHSDVDPVADETPESDYLVGERERGVRRALRALPAEQRQILRLSFYAGLSQSEIAERLDLPLGTVKSRMRLALNKIRHGLA